MKRILSVLSCILMLAGAAGATDPPELPYTFTEFDVAVPGQPLAKTVAVDLTDDGTVLLRTISQTSNSLVIGAMTAKIGNKKATKFRRITLFSCAAETVPESINNAGQYVGTCGNAGAFLHNPDGSLTILNNGPNTVARSISSDGDVLGSFSTFTGLPPQGGQNHGMIWDPLTGFAALDFPFDLDEWPSQLQTLIGQTADGQILGFFSIRSFGALGDAAAYWLFDPATGTFETGFAPLRNEFTDAAYAFTDMDDIGRILGTRSGQTFLWDDGVEYDVNLPEGWLPGELGGIAPTSGQFVGTARRIIGVDPYTGFNIFETFSYLATPAKDQLVKRCDKPKNDGLEKCATLSVRN